MSDETRFYTLPATKLVEGLSTDDGQDIVTVSDEGDCIMAEVYTPRSDDDEQDEQNRNETEWRIYDRDERVDLAVFPDTDVDMSDDPAATR